MRSGRLLAPAKLNLTLEILRARPDGYHGIRSLVVPVGLHDALAWEPADAFSFTCDDPTLAGEDNLVARAARALGLHRLPIALRLEKRIPAGAGLGGGSSDAAAVLRAALGGAFGPQPARDWLGIAGDLGSDVPLFLSECATLIEGRGERVTALGPVPPWHAVLATPDVHVSTRAAYAMADATLDFGRTRPRATSVGLRAVEALQRGDFAGLVALAHNDFEACVVASDPRLRAMFDAYAECGVAGRLTGSGAASFALFEDRAAAEACADRLRAHPAFATCGLHVAPFEQGARYRGAPNPGDPA